MRRYDDEKKDNDSGGLHLTTRVTRLEISASTSNMAPRIPNLEMSSGPSTLRFNKLQPSDEEPDCSRTSDLRFNRLQPTDKECDCRYKRFFGRFVAREAFLDEEYWVSLHACLYGLLMMSSEPSLIFEIFQDFEFRELV